MAGARWLRQRSNARKCEFAMKALTVWRAVPPCCHAVLAQSMRAQHASNTTARANYHTHLPSFKRPATRLRGHRVGDADDGTSRQRGAWDVSSNWAKITFIVSSLERPHRRGHRPGRHEHAKRRHEHAAGDHEITPSSARPLASRQAEPSPTQGRDECDNQGRVLSESLRSLRERSWESCGTFARGCVLECDADAVASGISDRLFGLVADVIAAQAATQRPEGGEVGIWGKPFL